MPDPTPGNNPYLDQITKDAKSVGWIPFHVTTKTPSMLGSGYAGNDVWVAPQAEYAPGDDVVYDLGDGRGRALHTVTHVKPGFVFVKGSFNANGDGWFATKDIIGKVQQTVRAQK